MASGQPGISIMKNNLFSYPQKGDDLFKKIPGFHNACLSPFAGMSPCGDNFAKYIAGYKDAADILVKNIIDNNLRPGDKIMPIIFLYRHFIELSLKAIIKYGNQLFNIRHRHDYPQIHNISELWKGGRWKGELWEGARRIIEMRWPNGEKETLDAVEYLIGQFAIIDPGADSSRYYELKNGSLAMENLSQNQIYVNIENMFEIMGSMDNFMSGVVDGIYMSIEINDNVT